MWATILKFSPILLFYLSLSDATKVKLIRNGSKTTHKDGVTHQVTKYIIVPENSNVIYENDDRQTQVPESNTFEVENSNVLKTNEDSDETDSLKHKVKKFYYGSDNHHHHHHHRHQHLQNGNVHYSQSHSYASSGEKAIRTDKDKVSGFSYNDLDVPKLETQHIKTYRMKLDKTIDKKDDQGDLNTYGYIKSIYTPFKTLTHNTHHSYETGEIEKNEGLDIPSESINDMIKNISNKEMADVYVNAQSVVLHGSDSHNMDITPFVGNEDANTNSIGLSEYAENMNTNNDEKTHNTNTNNIGLSEYGENININNNEKMRSSDLVFDKNSHMGTNNQNYNVDEMEQTEENEKIVKQDNDTNVLTTEKINETHLNPDTTKDTGDYESGENEQDIVPVDIGPDLLPLDDSKSETFDPSLSVSDTTSGNDKTKVNPDIYTLVSHDNYGWMNTDFDTSYPKLKPDMEMTVSNIGAYSKNDTSLPTWKVKHNLRYNSLNYTREPDSTGMKTETENTGDKADDAMRTSYDYFYLDDRPDFGDEQSSNKEKVGFINPIKLKGNGKAIKTEYNNIDEVPILSTINTEFNNMNTVNSGLNTYDSDPLDVTTINIKLHKTYVIPGKFPNYSIFTKRHPKFISKMYDYQSNLHNYKYGFVNGEKHTINDDILKYITSQKHLNSLNERYAHNFVIINGENHAPDENVLKYIPSHKQQTGLHKRYKNVNAATKEYENTYEKPIFNKIHKSYQIRNIYDRGSKSVNLLDNQHQCIYDKVLKYITKRPGNSWQMRYINTLNELDLKNLEDIIQNRLNRINHRNSNVKAVRTLHDPNEIVIDPTKDTSDLRTSIFDTDNNNSINENMNNINNIMEPVSYKDFHVGVVRQTVVERKYNLGQLKEFLFKVVVKNDVDSIKNTNLLYNNVLKYIVLLDSHNVSKWVIIQLIRKIQQKVLNIVKIISLQRQNPYYYFNHGNLCPNCHQ